MEKSWEKCRAFEWLPYNPSDLAYEDLAHRAVVLDGMRDACPDEKVAEIYSGEMDRCLAIHYRLRRPRMTQKEAQEMYRMRSLLLFS